MNDTTIHGGPAYPTAINHSDGTGIVLGMTLLDHFAGEALPIAMENMRRQGIDTQDFDTLARDAYEMAESMLAERARRMEQAARAKRTEQLAKQMNELKADEGPRIDLMSAGRRG